MTKLLPLAALFSAALAQAAPAPPARAKPLSAAEIVAQAKADEWRAIPPGDLLVMDLADGKQVVIALASAFAPIHVANIRLLGHAGWWDGTSVNRVQDNYVVQWGDATEKKPLPPGIAAKPPAEYERQLAGLGLAAHRYSDAYARTVGHAGGWPVAIDGAVAWMPHCYGMVGVGRDLAPDTGTGAELYVVIGQAPRHLDRNIAVVGRVIEGIEALTALPRGTGPLGFYEKPEQRVAIGHVRLAADMPPADRPAFEILSERSPSFARWITARANRKDDFFIRPAAALDICNAMPPVRRKR